MGTNNRYGVKEKLRIKLIAPPVPFTYPDNVFVMPPYGLGIVAAQLKACNFDVSVDDLFADELKNRLIPGRKFKINFKAARKNEKRIWDFLIDGRESAVVDSLAERLIRPIKFNNEDVFGITVFSHNHLIPALLIAKKIKQRFNKITVLGGAYITYCDAYFLKLFDFVDYMIEGDGPSFLKLLYFIENTGDMSKVPGLSYRADSDILKVSKEASFSMNNIPIPYFDEASLDIYRGLFSHKKLILPYQISSGCCNRCNFCPVPQEGSISFKSHTKVLSDLRAMTARYNTDLIYFCDSNIAFSGDYLRKLCLEIEDNKLNIRWASYAAFDNLDFSLLSKMYKSGCRTLLLGVETGSAPLRKAMGKACDISHVTKVLKASAAAGIKNIVSFITGYPHEKSEDISHTVNFIRENRDFIFLAGSYPFAVRNRSPIFNFPEKYDIRIYNSDEDKEEFKRRMLRAGKSYEFDEIGALAWKDKTRQQRLSDNMVMKNIYRSVIAGKFIRRLIPFRVYKALRSRFFNPGLLSGLVSRIALKPKALNIFADNNAAR